MHWSKLLKAAGVAGVASYLLLTAPKNAYADQCDFWLCETVSCNTPNIQIVCEAYSPGCKSHGGACSVEHPNCHPPSNWFMCVGTPIE